ncbi:hypothetical protein JRQ81_006247 [Phrynocephalus forsythii]|uniref:G-patch domain-containing protein n=1 Tax=Phrynocephalus forsythii TaxID=171643 RepID=A0A9Q0XED2_9SAUR|nr:hypothetical protein JRQ81_006247 [Phrynocephalus forsythii]
MAASTESDGEEEDLVSFGTPLEPLEEGERIKKPVPLQEQTVRDEKGRYKRFHGAFSGGFSAGYFNTVGSKEGWAPSSFVSSRQKRAEKTVLGPEDFMDEEDLGEHGIAPKEIRVTDEYASKSKEKIKEKARQIARIAGPIPGATVLDEYIAPPKMTVGVDLLRKMGWKEGQGVGPRVKRKPRKQNLEPAVKIYGCALPPGSEDSEEEDEYTPENVTFAPKDIMPVDLTPKDNVHGLGYKGLDPTKVLFGVSEEHLNLLSPTSENSALLRDVQHSKGRKLGISGQAFGVGALEEEDDDIYATESLSKYDTVMKDEEPGDGLYGWTAPKQYRSKQRMEKELKYIGKILDGFSLASKSITPPKIYLPPDLPRDYKPVHYFRPVIKASSENSHLAKTLAESSGKLDSDAALQSRHQKTAAQRRELLGETSLKGPATSVLEYLSDKDKERIQEMKQAAVQPVQSQELLHSRLQPPARQGPPAPPKWQLVLGAQLATAGSSDFIPFAKKPEKQKRYENYVQSLKHGKTGDALESCLDPSMTEWEQRRELEEFARAAMLYKTSSSVLSSRFTSAKHEDDADKVEVPRDQETDADDKAAAAKMKMFGKLTRERFEWHPDKLLCKRFNVPDPYSESCVVGLPKVKQPKKPSRWDVSEKEKKGKDAISEFISLARSKVDVQEQPQNPLEAEHKNKSEPASNQIVTEGTGPKEEEVEESRPSMDLFKSIFASSSDEKSSSSDESDHEDHPETEAAPENLKHHARSPEAQGSEAPIPDVSVTVSPVVKEVVEPEEFGPQLPPCASSDAAFKSGEAQLARSPEGTKREKSKKNKEKHKIKREHKQKKEKKKKHRKSKRKGKHKSKKSEKNSSSDTADSSDSTCEEQMTKLTPQELLRRLKHLPLVKQ